jgi:hypothetical protein
MLPNFSGSEFLVPDKTGNSFEWLFNNLAIQGAQEEEEEIEEEEEEEDDDDEEEEEKFPPFSPFL